MKGQLIECVPNISEGRNKNIIHSIAMAIESVSGVQLLNIDTGESAHRTVFTFAGNPEEVVEAAYQMYKTAHELIDMRNHQGEHPRMGAVDVCPLVPIKNISMEEVNSYAVKLAEKVGGELRLPVFLYATSAREEYKKNLAHIRHGEYEGLARKLKQEKWQPDYGPSELLSEFGITAIGARNFLIAYNVNLNTDSVKIATEIARDIRESGRVVRVEDGIKKKILGLCKGVKAIGWFIEEFQCAQVSMNVTDFNACGLYEVYEACKQAAIQYEVELAGSELVGLIPRQALLEAGLHYYHDNLMSSDVPEREIMNNIVKYLGLTSVKSFHPETRIIEYCLNNRQ